MKSAKSLRRDNYKKSLTELLATNKEAHKVAERYRVMLYLLNKEWSNLLSQHDKEVMKEFLKDVIFLDRKIRLETEGEDEDEKEILSQEFKVEELGIGKPLI